VSNAPGKPVSFFRPKVGYFSNRPRTIYNVSSHVQHEQYENQTNVLELSQLHSSWRQKDTTNTVH